MMLEFMMFGMYLVLALVIGGFVLNLVFMLLALIIGATVSVFMSVYNWIVNSFTRKKENNDSQID